MPLTHIYMSLLLLLISSETSTWTLSGRERCSGQSYDHLRQICCAGELRDLPQKNEAVACCGTATYDVNTHVCCRNLLRGEARIVVKQAGKSHIVHCVSIWTTDWKTE